MKKVEIYKVEYNISNRPEESWVAFVAGFTSKSVIEYVEGFVEGRVMINSMTTMSRLDAVTNEVREFIAAPLLPLVAVGKEDVEEKKLEGEKIPRKKSIVPKG